jgi:hypothetical protein
MKRQHSLMTHFKLSLARIEQMGYARAVSFNLSAAPLIPSAGSPLPAVSGQERSAAALNSSRSMKAMYADYEDAKARATLSFGKRQVQRANRNPDQHRVHWREDWELTAEQRARRIANRKWQATHRAKQRQRAVAKES